MAKSTSRRTAASPGRIKTAVDFSPVGVQRLGAASVAETERRSEIVEILINGHLAGYLLSVRGERIGQSDGSANSHCQRSPVQAFVA